MASNRTALLGNCLNRVARETPERSAIRDLRLQLAYLTMQRGGLRVLRLGNLPQPGIGDVFGLVVRARNAFSNLGAQLRTVARGEVVGYTKLLTASRNQARERMWQEARSRGANAVVAMRFDCDEIGDIMSEVAAYGTAVTAEPISRQPVSPDTTRADAMHAARS